MNYKPGAVSGPNTPANDATNQFLDRKIEELKQKIIASWKAGKIDDDDIVYALFLNGLRSGLRTYPDYEGDSESWDSE